MQVYIGIKNSIVSGLSARETGLYIYILLILLSNEKNTNIIQIAFDCILFHWISNFGAALKMNKTQFEKMAKGIIIRKELAE